ncbi:hypothetical protein [Adhaeribacter arboris]|nr:hypothetical protein [Adhaeribacter arboris]
MKPQSFRQPMLPSGPTCRPGSAQAIVAALIPLPTAHQSMGPARDCLG